MNAQTSERKKHLEVGLKAACERIADSGQTYEEANTAEGWFDHFMAIPLESHQTV